MLALVLGQGPALAIDGGTMASSRDAFTRSTVAIAIAGRQGLRFDINRCSGVLVRRDLVLTAAHCVSGRLAGAAAVVYEGAKPVPYPFWADAVIRYSIDPGDADEDLLAQIRALSLDVALVRLSAPVQGRRPVPIARASEQVPPKLVLAAAGLSQAGVGQLRTAALKPIVLTDTGLIIARALGARVCVGDSGGPVVEPAKGGARLWGVASAIISPSGPCGSIVVIAPARAALQPPG
jgi:secreted trypsin-like serine protease